MNCDTPRHTHVDPQAVRLTVLLVVPATNTTMGREVLELWPEISNLIRVGVPRPMRPIRATDLPAYRADTLRLVASHAAAPPDIVLYGCTTAGFLGGPAGDTEIQAAISQSIAAPTVTTASSMVQALLHTGIRHPAILTPYLEASNLALKKFLAANGFEVPRLDSMEFTNTEQYDQVTANEVFEFAQIIGRDHSSDGLFIACTQLPTASILQKLRQVLNKPVLSAIEATVWNAKRMIRR